MNPVIHFEMGAYDRERMKEFYQSAFGWKMEQMGPEMSNYTVVHTTETDEEGMVKIPGTINGGFYQKSEDPGSHSPSIVIAVKDIHQSIKEVEKAGGKILGAMDASGNRVMEPHNIPGVGLWMTFQDTEGNRVSMLQPIQIPQ